MILDALEVKLVRDKDSDEPADVEEFSWDVISYSQNFIDLQINFVNPNDENIFDEKDYLAITFWGIDFFKS